MTAAGTMWVKTRDAGAGVCQPRAWHRGGDGETVVAVPTSLVIAGVQPEPKSHIVTSVVWLDFARKRYSYDKTRRTGNVYRPFSYLCTMGALYVECKHYWPVRTAVTKALIFSGSFPGCSVYSTPEDTSTPSG